MVGRISPLRTARISSCASTSRPKHFLSTANIPLRYATSIRIVDCDPPSRPHHCSSAATTCHKGFERGVAT